jgi:hypothetical protein
MQLPCVWCRIKVDCDTADPTGNTALSIFGPCRFREGKAVVKTYKTTQRMASVPFDLFPKGYAVFECCFHRYLTP